jgi:acetyl esterase/lipase
VPDAIDPELAPALPLLPPVDVTDVDGVRAEVAAAVAQRPEPDLSGVTVSDERAGAVPLRVYRPDGAAPGAVYDVHGGGFVVGDLDSAHVRNVELARALGVTVVAVGYRLAPETPYPGPLDDVLTGWLWTREHVGPGAVRGESAGGGLAAGLALRLRDTGGPLPGFLLLVQPALDDRLRTPSMRAAVATPVWTRESAAASWAAYLGPHRDDPPPYAAPARATDLRGLPPAYVAVGQLDPLRDEGVAFALALAAADVPVELHLFAGTFHGSTIVEDAEVSRRQRAEEVDVLRQAARAPASRAAQSS